MRALAAGIAATWATALMGAWAGLAATVLVIAAQAAWVEWRIARETRAEG